MTKVLDVKGYTEEALRAAQALRDPAALEIVRDAEAKIAEAAAVIRAGGIVAFPTETVYGLGADAFSESALKRVYAAKGRPSDNPSIVHIARASDIGLLAREYPPGVVKLADAFWPGPLTIIVEKRAEVPDAVSGGLPTVGVRLPDNPVALALIRMAGTPIAAPSANLSGRPSPTRAADVIADLDGKVDLILAGADSRIGIESTVVDMTITPPQILRPGYLSAADLMSALDTDVILDPALLAGGGAGAVLDPSLFASTGFGTDADGGGEAGADNEALSNNAAQGAAPKSPGMKYRHYAPEAEMVVLEGDRSRVEQEVLRLKMLNERIGRRVGVLLFEASDFTGAAHDFYARLRDLDASGVDLILAGALPQENDLGFSIMNRMMKAAGYHVIRV